MAVNFQDYYATLGVARTATPAEIKQAFRDLARIHHPDVARDKSAGEAKFKEINEAYEVLGDPAKREHYDALGAGWPPAAEPGRRRRGPASAAGPDFEFRGTGFSDFFESYFSGRPGRRGSPFTAAEAGAAEEAAFSSPGADFEADLLVTLEEALRGATRKVTLRRPDAMGAVARTRTYQVKIPPGVRDGQRIRLARQGGAGGRDAPAGDLYLRVRLARHPDFRVEAADLHFDLDLAPWEAVLGAQVTIPSLDGPVTLRVPPGTATGRQLRLRALGLRKDDGARGDIYATVGVLTPHPITAAERALWEQLAALSSFRPRGEP